MKKIYLFCLALFCLLPFPVQAELTKPIDILNAMMEAHKHQNYQLHYILQQGENIESVRYQHAFETNQEFAQLLRLDNAYEMIILRDNTISYLGFNFKPFSLPSGKILDTLPTVFHTNFNDLKQYDFVPLGKSRVADRIANVIRIIPTDNSRFSYTLWIDEENYLLLKSELYDPNNMLLEQFRVIEQSLETSAGFVHTLKALQLPEQASELTHSHSAPLSWSPNWLPTGFKKVTDAKPLIQTEMQSEYVESQLYSDGLFTFMVYVRPKNEDIFDNATAKQGKLTLFTHVINDKEVVVIGDISAEMAQQIAYSVAFKEK